MLRLRVSFRRQCSEAPSDRGGAGGEFAETARFRIDHRNALVSPCLIQGSPTAAVTAP